MKFNKITGYLKEILAISKGKLVLVRSHSYKPKYLSNILAIIIGFLR